MRRVPRPLHPHDERAVRVEARRRVPLARRSSLVSASSLAIAMRSILTYSIVVGSSPARSAGSEPARPCRCASGLGHPSSRWACARTPRSPCVHVLPSLNTRTGGVGSPLIAPGLPFSGAWAIFQPFVAKGLVEKDCPFALWCAGRHFLVTSFYSPLKKAGATGWLSCRDGQSFRFFRS